MKKKMNFLQLENICEQVESTQASPSQSNKKKMKSISLRPDIEVESPTKFSSGGNNTTLMSPSKFTTFKKKRKKSRKFTKSLANLERLEKLHEIYERQVIIEKPDFNSTQNSDGIGMLKFLSDDLLFRAKEMFTSKAKKYAKKKNKIPGYMDKTATYEARLSPKRITARFNKERDWQHHMIIEKEKEDLVLYRNVESPLSASPRRTKR